MNAQFPVAGGDMVQVRALSKSYAAQGGTRVLAARDVAFTVPKGQIFTLLGPSGCGKTTTLRSIAGLEIPDSGEIVVNGTTVYSAARRVFVPSRKRGFGMVFQSYAIWPHMTVAENAAFPLMVPRNRKRRTRREIDDAVARVLDLVALAGLEDRVATQLSGGQQQRLALARAIITEPRLLLLDEPLSNLDAKLRERMRFELKRLQHELGVTTIYVTHDQNEALALSHSIAVMAQGRIVQIGTPRDIYERPKDNFVAEFIGTTNFLSCEVVGPADRDGHYLVAAGCGRLAIASPEPLSTGARVAISVRPEHVRISPGTSPTPDAWQATVRTQVFLGFAQDLEVGGAGWQLQARVHPSLDVPAGSRVAVTIDADRCVVCREQRRSVNGRERDDH